MIGAGGRHRARGLRSLRATAFVLGAWATLSSAQSITVSPLRADLGASDPVAVLSLRNDDPSHPTLVQARPSAWTIVEGEERFSPTRDLVVSPTVFRLEPGQEQVIRVSLRGRADERSERLYRVFLQQLSDEVEQRARTGNVRFLFTVGIPVVVAPSANPRPTPQVAWRAERGAGGEYRLKARNDGTAHLKITGASLASPAGETRVISAAAYLLPGTERSWTFRPTAPLPSGPLNVTVIADDGTSSVVQAALAD